MKIFLISNCWHGYERSRELGTKRMELGTNHLNLCTNRLGTKCPWVRNVRIPEYYLESF